MKIIKAILAFIGILIGGMAGGQGKVAGKAPRRFGIPGIALLTGFSFGWRWQYLVFLLFIPLLSLGYGQDSHLFNLCFGIEWLTRLAYSSLLAIPFVAFGLLRLVVALVTLGIAFQIHAGSLGSVPWFGDFLIEDIIRYSTLGALIIWSIVYQKK